MAAAERHDGLAAASVPGIGGAAASPVPAAGKTYVAAQPEYHERVTTGRVPGAWALPGDALAYAAEVHDGQLRKGTSIPYLGHLLTVAALVVEDGGSPEEVAAALLHDAAEDHGGRVRLADIASRFGAAVAGIVAECSDTLEPVKEPWRERKERYLAHLRHATPAAVRVSLADKVANLRTIVDGYRAHGERFWQRFDEDADPLWYYASVLAILRERSTSPLVGELQALQEALVKDVAQAPHPLPDAYWVADRLLAGDFPGASERHAAARRLRRLRWCGVSELVDLTTRGECRRQHYLALLESDMRHRRFAIADDGVPAPETLNAILAAIDESLEAGRVVYVHCAGGIGRAGTVAGCWLVRHGMPGAAALEHIAVRRAGTPNQFLRSPVTDEQREFVLTWR
jgi:hypothetical protein